MIIFLMKIWTFIKTHWQLLALIIVSIVSVLVLGKERVTFSEDVKRIRDAHDEEMKRINDLRTQEQKKHAENEKRLKDALDAVQSKYDAANAQLDEKKKSEIAELVRKYSDDPEELSRQLSSLTGFNIITPE